MHGRQLGDAEYFCPPVSQGFDDGDHVQHIDGRVGIIDEADIDIGVHTVTWTGSHEAVPVLTCDLQTYTVRAQIELVLE